MALRIFAASFFSTIELTDLLNERRLACLAAALILAATVGVQVVNHYSLVFAWILFLIGGTSFVLRRGRKVHHWIGLGALAAALLAAWWVLRPRPEENRVDGSTPTLIELQSAYCLACLAQKPVVDRVAREFGTRLRIRRIDIQSAEGQKLAERFGIDATPTFVFLDASGSELWRSSGRLDQPRLKESVADAR